MGFLDAVIVCSKAHELFHVYNSLIIGETHKIAEHSFCHIHPYHKDNPCGPLRTH